MRNAPSPESETHAKCDFWPGLLSSTVILSFGTDGVESYSFDGRRDTPNLSFPVGQFDDRVFM